ncbi:MAG: hypothetical protein IJ538_05045 [Clostridia bacterium]|nr:hypothetical protein [Clostridia bacterium]
MGLFGKKKKQPKIEKVFEDSSKTDESVSSAEKEADAAIIPELKEEENPEEKLSDAQRNKIEKLDNVKDKISKILQSSNIEIVDENFGDEYESGGAGGDDQQQQDYDALKALFGGKDKGKTQELTLTIDDFDYTYTGQYVDEFDLMHVKSIKKIRLQRKHSKHFKRFIIAAVLVVLIGVGAFLGYYFTRQTPVVLASVQLNQTEHDYYQNDKFDYTGLYFILKYSDGKTTNVKLNDSFRTNIIGQYTSSDGIIFTGNAGSTVTLTFTYESSSVQYVVNIKQKQISGISAIYTNGLFNLNVGDVITEDYLKVLVKYANYGEEKLDMSSQITLNVDGTTISYNSTSKGFVLTNAVTSSSTIVINYATYNLQLTNDGLNYKTTI